MSESCNIGVTTMKGATALMMMFEDAAKGCSDRRLMSYESWSISIGGNGQRQIVANGWNRRLTAAFEALYSERPITDA